MDEITYPPARADLVLATGLIPQCAETTHIDYEGLRDLECELTADHPGSWHYFSGDSWQGPMWWLVKTVVEVS